MGLIGSNGFSRTVRAKAITTNYHSDVSLILNLHAQGREANGGFDS